MIRRASVMACTMLLTFVTGSPALAEQISRAVHYRDLDLTTQAGVRIFRNRMRRAATLMCRQDHQGASRAELVDLDCRRAALAKAEEEVRRAVRAAEAQRAANGLASH